MMEDKIFYNKHYITLDEQNHIVNGFSDAFCQPTDTDICINEHGGYQFRLFPDGEENPSLFDWNGMIPLYKWENGEVIKRTEEEIEADRKIANTPTIEQQIESLKQQLSATDYKIIKCSEAQLLGEELPYDIASLHAERQALRDKINELEQQLEANEEGGAI